MMQWPGGRILQRHELDAFLAQAVSSQLYEPDQLQELKVTPHFITDLFMFAFDLTSSKKSCNIHTHTLLICSELSSVCTAAAEKYADICVSTRWKRWMLVACNWLLSLWLALTQHCSSMMCVASHCHGNTAVPGAFLMANCSRAN